MLHSRRCAFAPTAVLALGLLVLASAAGTGQPPKKARPSKLDTDLERFRGLDPAERLTLVTKLAQPKEAFTATKSGDLTAAIVERGTVEPVDYADLTCKAKAQGKESAAATIKWVIEDGTMVKKGQRVLTLDDSALRELCEAAAIRVKEAEKAAEQATDNIALVQKENATDVRLAEIDVKLAEIALKELPAEKPKEASELRVEQAKLKLERAAQRAKTQQTQAEAELKARRTAKDAEVEKLKGLEDEVKQSVLVAPMDGMLVYCVPEANRFGRSLPLIAAGEVVREGQKLARVVGLKKFAVGTRIHEAVISTVRPGQAVQVRVDAFPDKLLRGTVKQVSAVASAVDWMAADVKVYPVTVAIDDPPEWLKPQMSAEVQIATGEHKGVLQVPRAAALDGGRERTCFVKSGRELVERKVVVGASGATTVEIKEGLKEGDLVVTDLPSLLLRQ